MNQWYWINLKIKRKDVHNLEFFITLIILDLLLSPAIRQFKSNFECWRYHWSVTNNDGHRLKLFFKTTPEIAEGVSRHINSNDFCILIKKEYLETQEIKHEVFGEGEDKYKIEAISDSNWPDEIKKSFPYYIMGVCEMAINLIEETKKNHFNKISQDGKQEEIENYYKEIENDISETWKKYGNHAFFHHLAVVLGNKVLAIGTTKWQEAIYKLGEEQNLENLLALLLVIDNQSFPSS